VGAGGAGKSAAISSLARAYAQADAEVVVVALRSADGGRELAEKLEPHGVTVIAAADAEQAERRLASRNPLICLVDTPPAGPGEQAGVTALDADLQALDVDEVHLMLPATLSAAAADEVAAALSPLGVTHVALTHADQTARPGAPLELAMATWTPLSYVCGRDSIAPADATDLAERLLP
jgi:flagellar biosynthesis GTPase FlhF